MRRQKRQSEELRTRQNKSRERPKRLKIGLGESRKRLNRPGRKQSKNVSKLSKLSLKRKESVRRQMQQCLRLRNKNRSVLKLNKPWQKPEQKKQMLRKSVSLS